MNFDGFVNVVSKIASQKHLVAMRDGFASLMPILIAGSLAVLINNLPVPNWATILPQFMRTIDGNVWWGTFGTLTIFVVFSIAYNLARSYDANALATGLIALSSYISILPQGVKVTDSAGAELGTWGNIGWQYTNANALFVGIIISLIAAEIFIQLGKVDKLVIKMPDGVPPAVARSFAALVPGVVTVFVITGVVLGFEKLVGLQIHEFVAKTVSAPLSSVADTLPSAVIYAFLNHFLWIFGIHGANVLEGIVQPIWLPFLDANIAAFAAGASQAEIPHVITKQFFDTYVFVGGSGATLGLLIAIYVTSKSKVLRGVSNLSIAPGLFNINEPVIFGLPIVLNPIFAVPFLISPIVITIISYVAVSMGLAGKTVAIAPWSMPIILSGWLSTGGHIGSCILQVVNVAISTLIYLPFVLIADRNELKKEKAAA